LATIGVLKKEFVSEVPDPSHEGLSENPQLFQKHQVAFECAANVNLADVLPYLPIPFATP
jgi:hypothetical protein